MKAFRFRPQRALEWRHAACEREKQKLQILVDQSSRLSRQIEQITSGMCLRVEDRVSGEELAAFSQYQDRLRRELERQKGFLKECRRNIEAQREVVANANRQVELLERLKDKQRLTWKYEFDREIEQLAAESYLSRWNGRD